MTEEERAHRMKWWGYWPVVTWFVLVVVPWSTFLYGIAAVSLKNLRSREATVWFVIIASWGMIQFCYEIWFSGWIEKNFLHLEQRQRFYKKLRGRVPDAGWRHEAMEWVIGKIEDQMSRLHSKIRRFLYPILFGWGICPRIPKLPFVFLCRAKRSLLGFVFLASGNILRVWIELGFGYSIKLAVLGAWRALAG